MSQKSVRSNTILWIRNAPELRSRKSSFGSDSKIISALHCTHVKGYWNTREIRIIKFELVRFFIHSQCKLKQILMKLSACPQMRIEICKRQLMEQLGNAGWCQSVEIVTSDFSRAFFIKRRLFWMNDRWAIIEGSVARRQRRRDRLEHWLAFWAFCVSLQAP